MGADSDRIDHSVGEADESEIAISVVTATPDGFERIRKLLRHLAAQTIASRIELVVVVPAEDPVAHRPGELAAFARVTVVPVGPIDDVDRSLASGIREARGRVVAVIEDHAYPEPDWAEALVDAHRGPWAAVGPAFRNANPRSRLSWANMLMAYGLWVDRDEPGEMPVISRHNSSFKREILLAYGDDLERRLVRSGGILEDIRGQGQTLYFEPRARVAHVNPSRLRSTLRLRFDSGRLAAARRVERDAWSRARRAVYVAGSPLIPAVRLAVLLRSMRPSPAFRPTLVKASPALALALVADALGQACGFALGPGGSEARLRTFELDRRVQLRAADRVILSR